MRTFSPLDAGAAASAVLEGVPDADTLEDDEVALPPVRSVICLTPGDPAGRPPAALAWVETGPLRAGESAGRVEKVDAPDCITWSVEALVEAGGTYDRGGISDDVAPDGAGDDEVTDADEDPVGAGDEVVADVGAVEASGSTGPSPAALGGIFPIISCP